MDKEQIAFDPNMSSHPVVAVAGAAGMLGREIASRLERPRRITRDSHGDLTNADLSDAVSACDAVINCAAVVHKPHASEDEIWLANAELPVALAAAAKEEGVSRFVQISSTAAAMPRRSIYGRAKLAAEQGLLQLAGNGFSVACLRPPAIYGPGSKGAFGIFNRAAKMGLPLPLSRVSNSRSFAYVGNVADAAVTAASGDKSGIWIVKDSEPLSSAELYRRLLALHGHGDRVFAIPSGLLRLLAKLVLRGRANSLLGDAAFAQDEFGHAFNWKPPTAPNEALAQSVG